ncbi:MAG TPA: TonB-dependent receptor [Acidobacteriaceae bacterium]|nr:TonB-dependent receptor [Acidobacteriaceae bacterium]
MKISLPKAFLLLLLVPSMQTTPAQTPNPTGTIRGQIVDLQTSEPLAKVSISIAGQTAAVATDGDGRFILENVPAGPVELRVSTVGYGLLKRDVDMVAGTTRELDLRLGQDTLRCTQDVTVAAKPFDPLVLNAVTQYTLDKSELQDLSTVLANDPFRAVANLPGVAANQDFYADFAVRGADFPHVGVYLDGVLIDHPTYALEASGDLGSLSVVNGDVVRSVGLLSGAFPAEYGDRTGAILDIATRDGARDRIATRFTADVLGAALTAEGPIGKSKKASWLLSGRQSYLAYLLDRLGYSSSLTLNYNDITGKLSYDPNAHHRFNLFSDFGSTNASRSPFYTDGQAASLFTLGEVEHGINSMRWDWLPSPKMLLQMTGSWTHDHEHDTNPFSAVDLDTTSNVYGLRTDLTVQAGSWNKFAVGLESRSPHQQRNSYTQWNYPAQTLSYGNLLPFDSFSQSTWEPAGYLEDTATLLNNRVTINVGGRWQYSRPSSQSVWLPHASVLLRAAPRTNFTAAYGQYAQRPSLLQLYGAFGVPSLHQERATHEMFALDQFFTEKLRLHVELYNRQEHGDIYSPQTEFRLLPNGQIGFPVPGPVLGNNLSAYARGFEVSLQRRSANRLSGWISYARSYSKYWQPGTAFSFPGDGDQRNTFSAYGAYRISRTISLSGNLRYGSGLPISGFLAPTTLSSPAGSNTPVVYQLNQQRNLLRQGDYLRNDVRISKVFITKHVNLTVHAEIENLTGHTNYSYYDFLYPFNVSVTHQVDAQRQNSVPLLPAAGFTFEF